VLLQWYLGFPGQLPAGLDRVRYKVGDARHSHPGGLDLRLDYLGHRPEELAYRLAAADATLYASQSIPPEQRMVGLRYVPSGAKKRKVLRENE